MRTSQHQTARPFMRRQGVTVRTRRQFGCHLTRTPQEAVVVQALQGTCRRFRQPGPGVDGALAAEPIGQGVRMDRSLLYEAVRLEEAPAGCRVRDPRRRVGVAGVAVLPLLRACRQRQCRKQTMPV
jgi:hypothetical protein